MNATSCPTAVQAGSSGGGSAASTWELLFCVPGMVSYVLTWFAVFGGRT